MCHPLSLTSKPGTCLLLLGAPALPLRRLSPSCLRPSALGRPSVACGAASCVAVGFCGPGPPAGRSLGVRLATPSVLACRPSCCAGSPPRPSSRVPPAGSQPPGVRSLGSSAFAAWLRSLAGARRRWSARRFSPALCCLPLSPHSRLRALRDSNNTERIAAEDTADPSCLCPYSTECLGGQLSPPEWCTT